MCPNVAGKLELNNVIRNLAAQYRWPVLSMSSYMTIVLPALCMGGALRDHEQVGSGLLTVIYQRFAEEPASRTSLFPKHPPDAKCPRGLTVYDPYSILPTSSHDNKLI